MSDQGQDAVPGTGLAVAEEVQVSTGNMLQAFVAALTDPRVDAAKMPIVADTLIRLKDYERQEQFNRDKAAAIQAMPIINRKGQITKDGKLLSRFSKWEDLHAQIMPVLNQFNLVISHLIGHTGNGMVTVTPVLTHANGFTEVGKEMALPIDDSGFKNKTQGVGSAASYGQRYTTILMLNIRQQNVDDDGQATGRTGGPELNEAEEILASDAAAAAKRGATAYQEWFTNLSTPERGWLVVSGRHDKFKHAAGAA